jgi:hypothetical protein
VGLDMKEEEEEEDPISWALESRRKKSHLSVSNYNGNLVPSSLTLSSSCTFFIFFILSYIFTLLPCCSSNAIQFNRTTC